MLSNASKKGQSAFEYVVIIGIALLILIPLWLHISSSVGVTRVELQSSYTKHAVSKLRGAADAVYVQGSPAKFTLLLTFPEGVENVTISNNEISIRLSTSYGISDVIATTLGPVQGSISTSSGAHRVEVSAVGNAVNITEV
ncbi:hypothetical protein DRN67_03225 [Candidatus Micrarchaeota archaeon]|nr:MAG: hypothetical protein DRN67_03225 [Candidatus Micrarchaeota archaeon]